MLKSVDRRTFLRSFATGLGAIPFAGALIRNAYAQQPQSLTGVTWGGPWHDGAKVLAQKFNAVRPTNFSWELHQGGAVAILPKIKARWPEVNYDMVNGWAPVWLGMIEEGWLEPLDDLPNLKQIPEQYWYKDKQGRAIAAPMNVANVMWGYRTDMVKKPIRNLRDLLDPSLKGLVMLRAPLSYTGLQFVSMALEFGGNEKNIEPAFAFLNELARSGNIGRIGGGDVETINSMTTGETAVGFGASGVWAKIAQAAPTATLHRVDGSKGLKGFLYSEGWSVLKGPKAGLAKEFANFTLSAENNTEYNNIMAGAPTNINAKTPPSIAKYFYAPKEIDTYGYLPDFATIMASLDSWTKRFETEVVPLARRGLR
jgi:putative spermidine/putrescine transport system substrate-binding protein